MSQQKHLVLCPSAVGSPPACTVVAASLLITTPMEPPLLGSVSPQLLLAIQLPAFMCPHVCMGLLPQLTISLTFQA